MKISLVGNYLPDNQQSMQRFALMLEEGLRARGQEVELLRPTPRFGRGGNDFVSKWAAYIDKYVLFPGALRRAVAGSDVVHICDHSNAICAECRFPDLVRGWGLQGAETR